MRFEGTVGVSISLGEPGKAPGISSLSWRDASFAGTVRGARAGVSWDKETLFTGYGVVSKKVLTQYTCSSRDTCGVAEFLLDSLVERRAIVSDRSV